MPKIYERAKNIPGAEESRRTSMEKCRSWRPLWISILGKGNSIYGEPERTV